MCVSPIKLTDGTLVSCHKCWQCTENRIRDWSGRCIAESRTAKACHSVTLTYGHENGSADHVRAAVLTYSDVQKYMKRLRSASMPCRYLVAGEKGDLGRVHWHLIMFWTDRVPKVEMRTEMYSGHSEWSDQPGNGFTYWDDVNMKSVRYVCKYITKDTSKEGAQFHFSMSKKPPLGGAYFHHLAGEYVKAGLTPQKPIYTFPEIRDKDGKPTEFMLSGATLDLFCKAFILQWRMTHRRHWPHSEMISEYEDRAAKKLPPIPGGFNLMDLDIRSGIQFGPNIEYGDWRWERKETIETGKQRWQRINPGIPWPGRFDRGNHK